MSSNVVNLTDFQKALISRRRASRVLAALLLALSDAEKNDLMAVLRFDLTPEDVNSLETFTGNLFTRIEDRVYGRQRGTKGTKDQPVA